MYGWINACLKDLVITEYGEQTWNQILEEAGCSEDDAQFFHTEHYPDQTSYDFVGAASKVLSAPADVLLERFGRYFVHYLAKNGYEKVMSCQGVNFRGWIRNVHEIHWLVRSKFPMGSLPDIWMENYPPDETSVILHYRSSRPGGLRSVVCGVTKEVASVYYKREITMELICGVQEEDHYRASWLVGNVGSESDMPATLPKLSLQHVNSDSLSETDLNKTTTVLRCPFSGALLTTSSDSTTQLCPTTSSTPRQSGADSNRNIREEISSAAPAAREQKMQSVPMSAKYFKKIFPFHVILDSSLNVIQVGNKLADMFTKDSILVYGQHISSLFNIKLPSTCPWAWNQLKQLADTSIELESTVLHPSIRFRGEVVCMDEPDEDESNFQPTMALLLSVLCTTIDQLHDVNLSLDELPRHSYQRDLLVSGEHLRTEAQHGIQLAQMTRKLSHESNRIEQILKTKRVFVRYVSHEIRTPLNIAVLGITYLEEQLGKLNVLQANPNLTETMEEIKVSCTIAVEILNDLLLYEKIDDGIFNLTFTRYPLKVLIEEAEKLFLMQMKTVGITLESSIADFSSSVCVRADKSKFHQVLRNLVSNAIKFTPTGGTVNINCFICQKTRSANDAESYDEEHWLTLNGHPIRFASSTQKVLKAYDPTVDSMSSFPRTDTTDSEMPSIELCPSFARIVVTDSGSGISAEDQNHLFNEFIQVNAEKLQNGQGSGLGLWIAANIIKMHGGRIGVMSEGEGKGSSFVVDIPVIVSSPALDLAEDHHLSGIPHIDYTGEVDDDCDDNHNSLFRSDRNSSGKVTAHSSVYSMQLGSPIFTNSPRKSLSPSVLADNLKKSAAIALPPRVVRRNKCPVAEARVLIVDDAPSNRKMVRRVVQDRFHFIEEAENGQHALDKFIAAEKAGQPFHVVMMDYIMPVMNGLDATRAIRTFKREQAFQRSSVGTPHQFPRNSPPSNSYRLSEDQGRPNDNDLPLESEDQRRETDEADTESKAVDDEESLYQSRNSMSDDVSVVIVGITGNGQDEDMRKFVEAGADTVLVKPFNTAMFMEFLASYFTGV